VQETPSLKNEKGILLRSRYGAFVKGGEGPQ